MAHVRNQRVQGKTQREEHEVGVLAAQVVRERGPEEATTDVEQAQQTSEARCDRRDRGQLASVELTERYIDAQQFAAEHFLQQWRSHAEDTDTRRHVQAQHQPDQTELRSFPRYVHVDVTVGDHGVGSFLRRSGPAFRFPAGWRHAVGQCATDHEHEVNGRHGHEALPYAHAFRRSEVAHQCSRQWCADHRAATEAHDRHAGRHAALVREPLDQGRHRRDIAQAQTDTADHAGADPHQPDLVGIDTQRGNQQTATPAQGRYNASLAWTGVFQPATPDRCRAAEEDEEQRVDPAEHGDRPVAVRRKYLCDEAHVRRASHRRGNAECLGQRQPEHREAVGHADAQVNGQSGRWNQPAVETGLGDDAFLGQERRLVGSEAVRRDARAHYVSPNC